jgi:hypothetical protein
MSSAEWVSTTSGDPPSIVISALPPAILALLGRELLGRCVDLAVPAGDGGVEESRVPADAVLHVDDERDLVTGLDVDGDIDRRRDGRVSS